MVRFIRYKCNRKLILLHFFVELESNMERKKKKKLNENYFFMCLVNIKKKSKFYIFLYKREKQVK